MQINYLWHVASAVDVSFFMVNLSIELLREKMLPIHHPPCLGEVAKGEVVPSANTGSHPELFGGLFVCECVVCEIVYVSILLMVTMATKYWAERL